LPELDAADPQTPRPSVFLSYASADRQAARLLRDVLPSYGLDVWYDESEIGGGEAWDQKIRRQIRECDYFMPVVSAQTEARHEGYFRREWRLAVERTLDMADDHLFLLPIVIDDTDQSVARVPEKFLAVQWLRVPGGQPTRALESLCRRIASGNVPDPQPVRPSTGGQRNSKSGAPPLTSPVFPLQQPGQRLRFGAEVGVWAVRWGWVRFRRLPRWIRAIAYLWITVVLISRCEPSRHPERHTDSEKRPDSAKITPAEIEKLKTISEKYQGSVDKNDVIKLGSDIAKEFSDDPDETATERGPLLAIAFSAPAGDAAAAKLADSTFAMTYGMVAISHRGQVSLTKEPLPSRELGAALERGRANHSRYVLSGTVDEINRAQVLTVTIAKVRDGSVIWTKSYPTAGADPAKIAAEVDANMPPLEGT
jgi:TolB-like protein